MTPRILLVEDEPGLVMTLTDRLSSEGYGVESAQDAETGLARSTSEAFDLIILDVMLRQKLEPNQRHPQFILTIHGTGYKFSG